MRRNYLLIFLALSCCSSYGQTIAEGYYVSLNNDTVKAEIKVPKMIFQDVNHQSLERKIKVVDSGNERFEKFKPDEIKGFGFSYKNKEYNFASKKVKEKSRPQFFEQVVLGSKASLYFYYATDFNPTTPPANRRLDTYIVENVNGDHLILLGLMTRKKIKNKLKDFFGERANAQAIIDASAVSKRHLKDSLREIIEALNNS